MIIFDLLQNLTLLIALSVFSGFVDDRYSRCELTGKILQGMLFGITAVVGMIYPFKLSEGIIFDGRSIIISLCTVFFGPISGVIAAGIAFVYRYFISGAGVTMGILVIISSFLIGYWFHINRKNNPDRKFSTFQLFQLGLLVHIAMLLLVLTLPLSSIVNVYKAITLMVIGAYPLVTILIGKILLDQEQNQIFIKKLSDSEERLRLSLKAANQGLYDLNIKTGQAVVNDEYATMLGYDPKTFVETNTAWIERLHPADRVSATQAYTNYLEGKTSEYRMEFRLRTANNGWKWILSTGKIVEYDSDGKPQRLLGTHTDISELKKTAAALQMSEEKFAKMFHSSPDAIILTEVENGLLINVNEAAITLTGYNLYELIGNSTTRLNIWFNSSDRDNYIKQLLQNGRVRNFETQFRIKSGEIKDALISGEIIELNGQKFILGVIKDITDRKKIERSLYENQMRLKSIVQNAPVIIFGLDKNGVFTFSEGKGLEVLELKPGEVVGQSSFEAYREYPSIVSILNRALKGEVLSEILDLGKWAFDVYCAPIKNENGDITDVIGVATDITERRKAEDALKRSLHDNLAIVNSFPDILFRLNRAGVFIDYRNPTATPLFVPPNEFLDKKISDVFSPEYSKMFYDKIEEAFISQKITTLEYALNMNGTEIYFEAKFAPISNDELFCFVRDITERRKTETDLVESEAKFRNIFNAIPVPLAINDLQHNITLLNREFIRTFGYTLDDIPNLNKWWPLAYPDEVYRNWVTAEWEKNLIKSMETGRPFEPMELKIRTKDGNYRIASVGLAWLSESVSDAHLVYLYDITEIKQAEEKIRKNNEDLAKLFNLSMSLMELTDESKTLEIILTNAIKIIGVDTGAIYHINGKKLSVECTIPPLSNDFPKEFREDDLINHPHIQKAVETAMPVIIDDVNRTEISAKEKLILESRNMKSLLYLPLIAEKKTIGVLILGTIERVHNFTEHEIDLCGTISNLASLSMENSILFSKLNKNVRDLKRAVEEKNVATDALKESEARFHAMFEKHNAVMLLIEPESGKIIEANQAAEQFYGYSIIELCKMNISDINQLASKEFKKEIGEATRELNNYFHFPHRLKSGEIKFVEVFSTPITVKDITLLFSIIHDITERRIAEKEVQKSQQQLRALAARLEAIREDERVQLSRELHDNLGQSLTGLKMDVAWLTRKMESKKQESVENFLSKTKAMSELIDQIINDVRRISTELRPNLLDYLGLSAALEWLVNDFKKRTEVDCKFKSNLKSNRLEVPITNSIYRIIQEGFTNISRHSNATRVDLEIIETKDYINFLLKDNGRGIEKSEMDDIKSLGIRGMRERSLQLNAILSITGKKNKGTVLSLTVPKGNRK